MTTNSIFDGQKFYRSNAVAWILVSLQTFVHAPLLFASIFNKLEDDATSVAFSSILVFTAALTVCCGWMMLFASNKEFVSVFTRKISIATFAGIFSISSTLLHSLLLLKRVWIGECIDSRSWFDAWQCNTYQATELPPIDSVILLMGVPILLASIINDRNIKYTIASWAITVITLGICFLKMKNILCVNIFCIYFVASILIITENFRRSMLMFDINQNLISSIEENQLLAEETKATEMRHMIANVAHDLKTPLSSFMFGIDLISKELDSYHKQVAIGVYPVEHLIDTIATCLKNIHSTNDFMLMTINRCIDFAKASKGLKLSPKYETIDLMETLSLPLNCMMNVQSKVRIHINPITESICSHIITDKQWLQENILCLLSNAVKYSTDGNVSITASVIMNCKSTHAATLMTRTTESNAVTETDNHSNNISATSSRDKPSFFSYQMPSSTMCTKIHPNGGELDSPNAAYHDITCNSVHSIPCEVVNDCEMHRNGSQSQSKLHSPRDDDVTQHTQLMSGRVGGYDATAPNSSRSSPFQAHRRSLRQKEDPVCTHHLLFEVEDTGIGLSEEAMQSLFNPFKQTQRLAGGTGLGLYSLAKRVEALSGRYGVKKRKDGTKGSLFWFTIPYKADQVTSLNIISQAIRNNIRDSVLIPPNLPTRILSKEDLAERVIPISISQDVKDDCNLHILMAEDSHTVAKMTSMMLKRQGYKVTVAENGEIALKLILDSYHADEGKVKYDVVLMDLQMPVMDGLEATRRLRKLEKESQEQHTNSAVSPRNKNSKNLKLFPHVLVIGVSANSDHETMDDAFQAGIDAFISKPFAIETFTDTFHNLIFR